VCHLGLVVLKQHFLSLFDQKPLPSFSYYLVLFLPLAVILGRSALDLSFTLLGLMFLSHCIQQHDWQLFKPKWVKLALFIWLYLVVRSVFAIEIANNIDRGLFFGRFILGLLAIEWVFSRYLQAPKRLFQVSLVVVTFLIFDIYFQFFTGYDLLGKPPIDDRLTGPLNDVRVGRILIMLAFPLVCWAMTHPFFQARPRVNTLIGLSCATILIGAVFVTGERMMFLLSIFGILLAFLCLPHHKKYGLLLLMILPLFVALISVTNPKIIDRQIHSTQQMIEHLPNTPYGQIWRNALKVGMQNPLFGVGPKNFREVCPSLPQLDIGDYPIRAQCNLHAHNFYIEWFAETGIVGLALFIALVYLWLSRLFTAVRLQRDNAVLIGFGIFAVLFLLPIRSSGSFFTNSVALPFWFLLGWGLALTRKHEN